MRLQGLFTPIVSSGKFENVLRGIKNNQFPHIRRLKYGDKTPFGTDQRRYAAVDQSRNKFAF